MSSISYRHCLALGALLLGACASQPVAQQPANLPPADGKPSLAAHASNPTIAALSYVDSVQCDSSVDADLLFGRGQQLYEEDSDAAQQKAASCFELAANKGDADARCYLAVILRGGRGVPADRVAATQQLREAAKRNNACAEYGLGNAYLEGDGVKANAAEARRWHLRAAHNGMSSAQLLVAQRYEQARDRVNALVWYQLAAEYGEPGAAEQASALQAKLSKAQRAQVAKRLAQTKRKVMPLDTVSKGHYQRNVLSLLGHVDRYFPALYRGLDQQQRFAKTLAWADSAYARGFISQRDFTYYVNIIGFLGEDALNGSGKWPAIDRILADSQLSAPERIEQAAIKAESLQRASN